MTRSTIKITVLENGTEQTIKTYKGEYRNLMELLKDTLYFDCFGDLVLPDLQSGVNIEQAVNGVRQCIT